MTSVTYSAPKVAKHTLGISSAILAPTQKLVNEPWYDSIVDHRWGVPHGEVVCPECTHLEPFLSV